MLDSHGAFLKRNIKKRKILFYTHFFRKVAKILDRKKHSNLFLANNVPIHRLCIGNIPFIDHKYIPSIGYITPLSYKPYIESKQTFFVDSRDWVYGLDPDPHPSPKPNENQIQNLISIHFGIEIKKKIFRPENSLSLKNFFFFLISIPKCIEFNSESGSRRVFLNQTLMV